MTDTSFVSTPPASCHSAAGNTDKLKNTRMIAKDILQHFPDRGRSVRRLYRNLIASKRFVRRTIDGLIGQSKVPDPDTIYWIDPKRIEFHTNLQSVNPVHFEDRVFNMNKLKGAVLDGDWDLSPYWFTDLDVYKAFEAVIRNGACWQDTAFYRLKLQWIENGRVLWGCRSRADFDRRCDYLDCLVESIRKNGYRISSDCEVEGEIKGVQQYFEEVTVNIGRNGQYLFQDGRHRLSIALLLGIERIPVKVLVRHVQWQAYREVLKGMASGGFGFATRDFLFQPHPHPDLLDIPSAHVGEDGYAAIRQHLGTGRGKVLDIGANLGIFAAD